MKQAGGMQVEGLADGSAHLTCARCPLRRLRFFSSTSPDLAAAVEACHRGTRELARGEILFEEGDRAQAIYTLCEGWAIRYKLRANGERQILAILMPGDFIGWQSDAAGRWNHAVVAVTKAKLCCLDVDRFRSLVASTPDLPMAVALTLRSDEGLVFEHMAEIGREAAIHRVAHLMIEIFLRQRELGAVADGSCPMPLTQEMIGDAVGLTPAHVNRCLRELRERQVMSVSRSKLTIRDIDGAVEEFDFDVSQIQPRPLL